MRIKAYWVVDKWLNKVTAGLLSLHYGIWLGLLDRPALQQAIEEYYATISNFPDRSHNLSGFFLWEAWVMGRFFRDCQKILVAAAGGGRETIALAKRGFYVDGFDCNEELVIASQDLVAAENINSRIISSPPDQVPAGLGEYDGTIIGWGAYTHIGGRERRVHFLQQLRLHIAPGSPILLSFLTRHQKSQSHKFRFAVARIVRQLRRSSESVEMGDDLCPTFMHRFANGEIEDELTEGGFKLIYITDEPYGHAVARAV